MKKYGNDMIFFKLTIKCKQQMEYAGNKRFFEIKMREISDIVYRQ